MTRFLRCAVAAVVLIPLLGAGVATAGAPVPPKLVEVTATWGMLPWDDGSLQCTLTTSATLDPGFTKGQPVYAHASMHFQWVGPGGTPIDWREYDSWRLSHGVTTLRSTMAFMADGQGYYVVDGIRFQLVTRSGLVLSEMQIDTHNTCLNGPA